MYFNTKIPIPIPKPNLLGLVLGLGLTYLFVQGNIGTLYYIVFIGSGESKKIASVFPIICTLALLRYLGRVAFTHRTFITI